MHVRSSFTLLLLVMSCLTFVCSLNVEAQANVEDKHKISVTEVQSIAAELKYIDEVLTSSVLSYAFSGDNKWLVRYEEFEPKLSELIHILLANQSADDVKIISELELINNRLVAIENKAIDAVKSGDRQSAMLLINSDEYLEIKGQYLATVMSFIANIESRIKQHESAPRVAEGLNLTPEEKQWIATNKVKVGVEHWPPILYMQGQDNVSGLNGAIINQIVEKTGLEFEYVPGSWADLLAQFERGEIDLLPDSYLIEERKAFGYFSTPFFLVRELFYVKSSNLGMKSVNDLAQATIAVSDGYTTIDKVTALYPNITVIRTSGLRESIDMVINGQVDAVLDAEVVIDDWLLRNQISDIKKIDEDVILPTSLHFFTHLDHPILHGIIQKSLDSLRLSDIMLTNNNWLKSTPEVIEKQQEKRFTYFCLVNLRCRVFIGGSGIWDQYARIEVKR